MHRRGHKERIRGDNRRRIEGFEGHRDFVMGSQLETTITGMDFSKKNDRKITRHLKMAHYMWEQCHRERLRAEYGEEQSIYPVIILTRHDSTYQSQESMKIELLHHGCCLPLLSQRIFQTSPLLKPLPTVPPPCKPLSLT